MTDQRAEPDPEPAAPQPAPTCPWCGAPATHGATRCSACGAALAQHESLGGVRIPGLTSVDPALEDFDKRPLHIPGPSPTQGMAPALIIGALAGGPAGLVAMGGVAALAGVEFVASQHDGTDTQELADVGRPSELALQALRHLDTGEAADTPPAAPATPADDGLSIWRDLPPATEGSDQAS
ncbi:MAG: hypothetical protein HYX55_05225 [Chloroflexi bacterium]|nr:hypothetical protein [Chloroflexota bacterium]